MKMSEIHSLLDTMMREIDKKTAFTVAPCADAGDSRVTVQLKQAKRTGSLQVTEADLLAAQTDLTRRNRLRTALKRTHDHMWDEARGILSTKVERPKQQGAAWFHPSQRGRGRR
jgi:hypothetical protein